MARKQEDDILYWFTAHGHHIPVKEGQSKADALRSVFSKDNDQKERQIKENKKDADKKQYELKKGKEVDSKQFNKDITDARNSRPVEDKWRVDVHSSEEYDEKGCKMWTSNNGSTVAVTSQGDIISVCKHMNDRTVKGKELLSQAVSMGGTKLDSFSGNHKFYTSCGFEPVSWTPFNKEYAPDGWKESGADEEPVIFYKYVGIGNVKNLNAKEWMAKTKPFEGDDGYDNAYAYRDKQIKK